MRSFVKIKLSRNDEITLSFTDIKSVKKARSAINHVPFNLVLMCLMT